MTISYALAVGLLSQRLTGAPAVQAPWPRSAAFALYQRSLGLPADGYPTLELLQRLQ